MRRTILASTAIAMAMMASQASAGLFFRSSSCATPAVKCCAPAPTCCNHERRCFLTGIRLPKLRLPKLRLPKLNLFGRKCCQPAPTKCCKPAPPTCSGGHGSKSKVEEVAPPYEAPEPPAETKAPAPAPAAEKKAAPAPAKKAPAPAPEKK